MNFISSKVCRFLPCFISSKIWSLMKNIFLCVEKVVCNFFAVDGSYYTKELEMSNFLTLF